MLDTEIWSIRKMGIKTAWEHENQKEANRTKFPSLHESCRYTDWRLNLLHGAFTAVFVGSRTVNSLLPPARCYILKTIKYLEVKLKWRRNSLEQSVTHTHTHTHSWNHHWLFVSGCFRHIRTWPTSLLVHLSWLHLKPIGIDVLDLNPNQWRDAKEKEYLGSSFWKGESMIQRILRSILGFLNSTTWKVDGASPMYWFIVAPY